MPVMHEARCTPIQPWNGGGGGGLFRLHTGRMYRDGMITVFCPGSIQSFVLRKLLILLYVIRRFFCPDWGLFFVPLAIN